MLKDVIKRNLNWLHAENDVKNLFSPGHMGSFRGARTLSSYLVQAKLYPLECKIGSCSCDKERCQASLNVTGLLTSSVPIRHIRSIICLIVVENV